MDIGTGTGPSHKQNTMDGRIVPSAPPRTSSFCRLPALPQDKKQQEPCGCRLLQKGTMNGSSGLVRRGRGAHKWPMKGYKRTQGEEASRLKPRPWKLTQGPLSTPKPIGSMIVGALNKEEAPRAYPCASPCCLLFPHKRWNALHRCLKKWIPLPHPSQHPVSRDLCSATPFHKMVTPTCFQKSLSLTWRPQKGTQMLRHPTSPARKSTRLLSGSTWRSSLSQKALQPGTPGRPFLGCSESIFGGCFQKSAGTLP